MQRLKGKVALITGAAQGLGEALAHRLAAEGAKVAVADLQFEQAKAVADALPEAVAIAVDVTDPSQCQAMVAKTVEAFGTLDVVVSNAAILLSGGVDELSPAQFLKVQNVNLCGYYNVVWAAAPVMLAKGSGAIVQVNSKSGKKGSFKNSAYAASKFGGIGLTQSLALEFAPKGVRVNAICPGNLLDSPLWVNSLYEQYARNQGITKEEVRQKYLSQVPLGRGCAYEDVANAMVFLASDEASYMTGQAINVTGGQEMR